MQIMVDVNTFLKYNPSSKLFQLIMKMCLFYALWANKNKEELKDICQSLDYWYEI
jgi:hypothetical protein